MYIKNDEYYMKCALKEANKAKKRGEIPVGAVIVKSNKIIAKGYNEIEKSKNSLKHAEIIVINKACKKLKKWRLNDCILYTTMEPCMMCCGAIQNSRIKKIVYGIKNEQYGYSNKLQKVEITKNIMEKECREIIQLFFKKIR